MKFRRCTTCGRDLPASDTPSRHREWCTAKLAHAPSAATLEAVRGEPLAKRVTIRANGCHCIGGSPRCTSCRGLVVSIAEVAAKAVLLEALGERGAALDAIAATCGVKRGGA